MDKTEKTTPNDHTVVTNDGEVLVRDAQGVLKDAQGNVRVEKDVPSVLSNPAFVVTPTSADPDANPRTIPNPSFGRLITTRDGGRGTAPDYIGRVNHGGEDPGAVLKEARDYHRANGDLKDFDDSPVAKWLSVRAKAVHGAPSVGAAHNPNAHRTDVERNPDGTVIHNADGSPKLK